MEGEPEVQLCFYSHTTILTRRTRFSGWTSYPVNAHDIAHILGRIPTSSGLLLPNTVAMGHINGSAWYAIYIPPRRTKLTVDTHRHEIQTPPLLWCGCDVDYRIFALAAEGFPQTNAQLFHAPFPNVWTDGKICWGSSEKAGSASPHTLLKALHIFLEGSRFNTHLSSGKSNRRSANITMLYPELDPDVPYPVEDLMPTRHTVEWLIGGGPWSFR